jgi:hypothetical protein
MNKAKLPTKTKIAMWWLFVTGIIMTIGFIASVPALTDWSSSINPRIYLLAVAVGLLYISPGILLCIKRNLSWISSVVILAVEAIPFLIMTIIFVNPIPIAGIVVVLIPLILIILDRKNYFAMVRQRELEKKEPGNSE